MVVCLTTAVRPFTSKKLNFANSIAIVALTTWVSSKIQINLTFPVVTLEHADNPLQYLKDKRLC